VAKQRFLPEIVAEMNSPEWQESLERSFEIFDGIYRRAVDEYGYKKAAKAAIAVLEDYWFQEYRENE
jgi:hypothetical protein